MTDKTDAIAKALANCLISPNESDSNFEAANVVDGIFAIARALNRCAEALGAIADNAAAKEE